jgi:putative protease
MSTQPNLQKPEVMSPAGYWPQLNAAIEAGADAVYFGLHHFTARAKVGFALEELPEVMRTLHRRGVKGYVTFNTLVFDEELQEAARQIEVIARTDVDAMIVQDVGIARLIKQISPDTQVHGSTQMSLTSAEGVHLAQQFGVSRVVLARELSLDEIRAIRAASDCELEMFVHGALCVSYSGQCFSSEAWGGRSANRGQCAQACRLPYELIVDGRFHPTGDARYLLSPGDLYALHQISDIIQCGISALKIEGRYKDANYVALTTSAYRKAVDEAWAGLPLSITPVEELQLEQVYSRGLGPYFVTGTNHQTVVKGRSPRHRGVLIGSVTRVNATSVVITPERSSTGVIAQSISPVKPGDGLVFDAADWRSPQEAEEGGRVYEVTPLQRGQVELRFGNEVIRFGRIHSGDLVWRSDDPELEKVARPFTQSHSPVHKQPLNVRVVAHVGAPLLTEWTVSGHPDAHVTVSSPEPLVAAHDQRQSVTAALVREQLGRLGNTPYELAVMTLDARGRPFVSNSLLNQLRRQAVEQLAEMQSRSRPIVTHDPQKALDALTTESPSAVALRTEQTISVPAAVVLPQADRTLLPELHILVRTPEQLEAAIAQRPSTITLDYLELYGLRPAVEQVQAACITARVASPRILKPNEQRIVQFLPRLNCEILVRSTGLLSALRDGRALPDLIGDFSLNTANIITAETFLALGLKRLTPTHDLNAAQVAALAASIGPDKLEVVAYHHLPVFHTEHCVFCRFLSTGTSYKDCGYPCEKHRLALRDVNGREHPVMADVGCRNTVFGAEAQEASRHLDAWLRADIRHFRIEFAHETARQVEQVSRAWAEAINGNLSARDLGRRLQQAAPQGTTEGSLFVPESLITVR